MEQLNPDDFPALGSNSSSAFQSPFQSPFSPFGSNQRNANQRNANQRTDLQPSMQKLQQDFQNASISSSTSSHPETRPTQPQKTQSTSAQNTNRPKKAMNSKAPVFVHFDKSDSSADDKSDKDKTNSPFSTSSNNEEEEELPEIAQPAQQAKKIVVKKIDWRTGGACRLYVDASQMSKFKVGTFVYGTILLLNSDNTAIVNINDFKLRIRRDTRLMYPRHHFMNKDMGLSNQMVDWQEGDPCFARCEKTGAYKRAWVQKVPTFQYAEVIYDDDVEDKQSVFVHVDDMYQPHLYDQNWPEFAEQIRESMARDEMNWNQRNKWQASTDYVVPAEDEEDNDRPRKR